MIYSPNYHLVGGQPHICFSVGLPRSGKSTFFKTCTNIDHNGVLKVSINGDNFRLATYGPEPFNDNGEAAVSTAVFTAIKALLHTGYHVLYDDTNTSLWSLKKIFSIDKEARYVLFDTPREVCIKRCIGNKRESDLIDTIYRTYNNLKGLNINLACFDKIKGSENIDAIEQIRKIS